MMTYKDDDLWTAVGQRDLGAVQRAVLVGGDVNMVCPDSWVRDEVAGKRGTGRSLLHHAAWAGDLEVFKALVAAGANVGRRRTVAWRPNGGVAGRGSTPLHHAVMYNRLPIVEYLVGECGIDIDEPGEQGYTALHLATKFDHVAIAELLLRHGARTDLITRDEKTVWDLAKGQQDRSHAQVGAVQQLLERYDKGGAKREKLLPLAARPKQMEETKVPEATLERLRQSDPVSAGARLVSAMSAGSGKVTVATATDPEPVIEPALNSYDTVKLYMAQATAADADAASARLVSAMNAGTSRPVPVVPARQPVSRPMRERSDSASARLVSAMRGMPQATTQPEVFEGTAQVTSEPLHGIRPRAQETKDLTVPSQSASDLLVAAMGGSAPRKTVAFALLDQEEQREPDSLDSLAAEMGRGSALPTPHARELPAQRLRKEAPLRAQHSSAQEQRTSPLFLSSDDSSLKVGRRSGGSIISASTRSSSGSDLSSLVHNRQASEGAFHDPTSGSQNVGNHIGTRSTVRQSKLFRMYESGNAAKEILGQGTLQWNVNSKEGAYTGNVFDAYEGSRNGHALGRGDGREVGSRVLRVKRYEPTAWTTSSAAYGKNS